MTVMPMIVTNANMGFQISFVQSDGSTREPIMAWSARANQISHLERANQKVHFENPPEVAQLAHNMFLNRIAISGGV